VRSRVMRACAVPAPSSACACCMARRCLTRRSTCAFQNTRRCRRALRALLARRAERVALARRVAASSSQSTRRRRSTAFVGSRRRRRSVRARSPRMPDCVRRADICAPSATLYFSNIPADFQVEQLQVRSLFVCLRVPCLTVRAQTFLRSKNVPEGACVRACVCVCGCVCVARAR
jgi:hypothetical protein